VESEVAVEGGHYGLEESAEGSGAGNLFAGGLEEYGVRGIEVQNGFEPFGAKVLDPRFANLGEGYESRGLGSGPDGVDKGRREDDGGDQGCDRGAARPTK